MGLTRRMGLALWTAMKTQWFPLHLVTACAVLFLAPTLSAERDEIKMLQDFGWLLSSNLEALDLNEAEKKAVIRGFSTGLEGHEGPANIQQVQMELQSYLQSRFMNAQARKNEAFFEEIAQRDGVIKSDSGLYYEIIEAGSGRKAGPEDSVKVHYVGTLADGTEFDSSRRRGEPATFPVAGVVPGFAEGVQLVGPGGRVRLYIPPNLGYGENPQPGSPIPPNATLIFDVEMIDINP